MTISFHNPATKDKIVLFCLLSHSIYLIQPFKYYYLDAIDKAVWSRDEKFKKLKFLAQFQSFCN